MADVMPGMAGGHQDGGDGGLGLPVPVCRAVEQLGCPYPLGDEPHKTQLDVAGPQHGAGIGVLEPGWGFVEGILRRQNGPTAALKIGVLRLSDPLWANYSRFARQIHVKDISTSGA